MLNQITEALRCQIKSFRFIFKHRLYVYYFYPLLIFLGLLFFILIFSSEIYSIANFYVERLSTYLPVSLEILTTLTKILFYLFLFLFSSFFLGYIILIIMSPLLSLLSEKTESIIKKTTVEFDFNQFIKDIFRGVLIVVRSSILEIVITLVLMLFSFIPLFNFFVPVMIFFVSSYFYGFSFIDYNLERNKYSVVRSFRHAKSNRGHMVGTGIIFKSLTMIPFFGQLISVFYVVNATVAATLLYCEKEKSGEV